MTDPVEVLLKHVASYKTLSPHRQNCLEVCEEIEILRASLLQQACLIPTEILREALIEQGEYLDHDEQEL